MARQLKPEQGGCWPTAIQLLLLRAALLQGRECIDAWEKWKKSVDIENLDPGSKRLFPLLYRNLRSHGVEDRLLVSFKSAYRRTWRDNQVLFHQVGQLLRSLHAAGIDTIVLKGAALTLLHYRDAGVRPMSDFDLMIRVAQRKAAFRIMEELGWSLAPRSPERITEGYLSIVHAHGFTHAAGGECDLHWHLFPECCNADSDDEFWKDAVPLEVQGVQTQALAPTDQLLHVCVHGAAWNPIPPIRWIADAIAVMNSAPVDWNRLAGQAQRSGLLVQLRVTLTYLAENFGAPVPAETLRSLRELPVSKREIAEYKYKIQNYETKPMGFLPILWFRYLRLAETQQSPYKLMGFVKYLRRYWGAEHARDLAGYAALMIVRRISAGARQVSRCALQAARLQIGIPSRIVQKRFSMKRRPTVRSAKEFAGYQKELSHRKFEHPVKPT